MSKNELEIKVKDKVKCPHCSKVFTFESKAVINAYVLTSWNTSMRQK